MSCNLTKGFSVQCKDSIGGLKAVYFNTTYVSNMRAVAVLSTTAGLELQMDTAGFTTWLDEEGNSAPDVVFRYMLRPGASNLNTTINSSSENGTTFFTQTLSLTLPKLSVQQTNEIKLICQNRAQVWVEDNNGNLFLLGFDNGLEATGGTIVTGAARGDMSGFTLTLVGEEKEPMLWADPAVSTTGVGAPFSGLSDYASLTVTAG